MDDDMQNDMHETVTVEQTLNAMHVRSGKYCATEFGRFLAAEFERFLAVTFSILAVLTIFIAIMSMKINPPVFNSEVKSYERYKQELLAWNEITELPAAKRGIAIALSLPEGDKTRIREKVWDEITLDKLKVDGGFKELTNFMDLKLGKDELEDSLEKFESFEDYQRTDEDITQYIDNFDSRYQKIDKKGMKLPEPILAFKLLRRANLTKEEKLLVLTGMDYSKKTELYTQAQKSLKKFKGGVATGGASSFSAPAVKLEPSFLADNEEALWNAG
jgi:hypothetical protein